MTTYYVDPVGGDDAAAGTSFALAWKTTQFAADTAVAGDEVRLCATGTEAPAATIDFDINAGTDGNEIQFIGYNATGTAELTTGHYTISGASLGGTSTIVHINNVSRHFWKRIRLTGGPGIGLDLSSTTSLSAVDCEIDSNTSHGILGDSSNSLIYLVNCRIYSNGGWGATQTTSSRLAISLSGCSIYSNVSGGVNTGISRSYAAGCLVYSNGGVGLKFDNGNVLVNNVCHNNTSHGIQSTGVIPILTGNVLSNNGGYGISITTYRYGAADYNFYGTGDFANTSGETNLAATPGDNNQTGDPLFVNAASADFTPGAGSPLIGTGLNGGNIGAVAHAEGGGGWRPRPRLIGV